MPEILVGTSGYDYPEWVGCDLLYPPSLERRRSDWLTYYASQFSVVELNFTYYGESNPEQIERMVKRVDPSHGLFLMEGEFAPVQDFQFFIKAYASLTHKITSDWPQAARKFKNDIEPLSESNKLGGVLMQFPSRLHACNELCEYLHGVVDELKGIPIVFEPRHRSWFTHEWKERISSKSIVLSSVDTPKEAKLPLWEEQNEAERGDKLFSYLRLHGRREGRWWTGDNASRYEYNYSDTELLRFARRLLNSDQQKMFALFNNHRHGAAASNAMKLRQLVAELKQSFN